MHAARAAALLRRELDVDAELEAGPYGSFVVSVDGEAVVEGGPLAFMGVLPPLADIRARVAERLAGQPAKPGA